MNLLKSILIGIGLIAGTLAVFSGIVFLTHWVSQQVGFVPAMIALVVLMGAKLGVMMWEMDRPKK